MKPPVAACAPSPRSLAVALTVCSVLAAPAVAQTTAPGAAAPPVPPAPPAAAASAPQRVEITGGRASDTEERRRATAAKIVVGREEIEAYGDSTVGEVLRRLPGVTTPGTPGRGGPPRLRGLGGGFTQLLIDGQPIPRGFSLESLTPDQVERIEILRAPTAETGARAIAGTINIVLREGLRRRLNDLRLGFGVEDGEVSPGVFWTHNDNAGDLTYNLSGGAFQRRNRNRATATTETVDTGSGAVVEQARESRESFDRRQGVNAAARLTWRLGPGGDVLVLNPSVFHSESDGSGRSTLQQAIGTAPYEEAASTSGSRFTIGRLQGQWRGRLGDALRAEIGGNASQWQARSRTERAETVAGTVVRRLDDRSQNQESGLTLTAKFSTIAGGREDRAGSEHSLVFGGEVERTQRDESRTLLQDGLPLLTSFGDDLAASSTRVAAYAQDEWNPNRQWSLHAGLRWEGIATEGDLGNGDRPRNRNSVWTPLAHAVWKPDPASRSQVRASLTRSWRAPPLGNLIARPSPNSRFPVAGPNDPTHPDRAGNPDLRPELATGIDLAWEHYPKDGGVLSANLFHRRIRDLMRNVVALETVSWSPVPRWVSRPQNIGDAFTQGLELEAKGRLEQWFADAPKMELRANLSLFRSRVDGVPGPDNRLEQQAHVTANLGADYKIPSVPVKVGANINWVPGYETQVSAEQRVGVSTRRVVDAYALWTIAPAVALRLSGSNVAPRDSDDFNRIDVGALRETTRTLTPSSPNWQLRLELKL